MHLLLPLIPNQYLTSPHSEPQGLPARGSSLNSSQYSSNRLTTSSVTSSLPFFSPRLLRTAEASHPCFMSQLITRLFIRGVCVCHQMLLACITCSKSARALAWWLFHRQPSTPVTMTSSADRPLTVDMNVKKKSPHPTTTASGVNGHRK